VSSSLCTKRLWPPQTARSSGSVLFGRASSVAGGTRGYRTHPKPYAIPVKPVLTAEALNTRTQREVHFPFQTQAFLNAESRAKMSGRPEAGHATAPSAARASPLSVPRGEQPPLPPCSATLLLPPRLPGLLRP